MIECMIGKFSRSTVQGDRKFDRLLTSLAGAMASILLFPMVITLLPGTTNVPTRQLAVRTEGRRPASLMSATSPPKIVVTGIGVVSALGSGDDFWDALLAGKSGIDEISAFDASKYPTRIGAQVKVRLACPCSEVGRRA